jgi:hypothetical protein
MSDDQKNSELIYSNGINGASGGYLLPPQTLEDIDNVARGTKLDENNPHWKDLTHKQSQEKDPHYAVIEGIDAINLAQAGWGVIFAFADKQHTPAIMEALQPLLNLRKKQAGGSYKEEGGRYGEFIYRPDEPKNTFLARHGVGPGQVDPQKGMPYYLLIVGSPQSIPYEFQYQLGVQFAVGRIHFDTLEDYAAYAQNVVAAETGKVVLPRSATFFGVKNPDDLATNLSTEHLVAPLAQWAAEGTWRYEGGKETTSQPEWDITTLLGQEATKARLSKLLGSSAAPAPPPAFLFTASHGIGFPNHDPRQIPHQGALLCQDWPGPRQWRNNKAIPQDFYFAGDDITSNGATRGMIAFMFACFSAGTPHIDDFSHQAFKDPSPIAPHAFLANLPQRMLAKGGALAVVGHVERAWGYSFLLKSRGREYQQLQTFESTLNRLFKRHRIGSAFDFFSQRYAEIASDLSTMFIGTPGSRRGIRYGNKEYDPVELASLWISNHDARNYVIIGDPATHLPVAPPPAEHTAADLQQSLDDTRVELNSKKVRVEQLNRKVQELEQELTYTRAERDRQKQEVREAKQRARELEHTHRDVSVNIKNPKFDLASDNTLRIREITGKGDTITLPPSIVNAIYTYLKRKLGDQ